MSLQFRGANLTVENVTTSGAHFEHDVRAAECHRSDVDLLLEHVPRHFADYLSCARYAAAELLGARGDGHS
ncbi:MAG: hypothetical protein JWO42_115, partial [Chloroflexi bacterium]|nr:hypothetical protein [Chloroflexota bacterium]